MDGSNPLLTLLNYGVLGVVVIALVVGWLWAKPAVDKLIADKTTAEKQRDDLLKVFEEKVIPALLDSNKASEALKPVLLETNLLLRECHGRN